jgi:hypothetical protein
MRRRFAAAAVLAGSIFGCGGDADDAATPKTAIPFDQVPAHVRIPPIFLRKYALRTASVLESGAF